MKKVFLVHQIDKTEGLSIYSVSKAKGEQVLLHNACSASKDESLAIAMGITNALTL
jgi:hypothetical protein